MSRTPAQRRQRALDYLQGGQLAPARAQLEALRSVAPNDVCASLLAAEIALREGRVRDASAGALDAARRTTGDPGLACDVAAALLHAGETVAARTYLAHQAWADDAAVACLVRRSDFALGFGDYAGALALLDEAVTAAGHVAATHFYRGRLLTFLGRFDEAEAGFRESLRLDPSQGEVALALVALRAQTRACNHMDVVTEGLRVVARGTRSQAAFELARYKMLEDFGNYDEAWQALARGNEVMHARTRDYAQRQGAALQRSCDYFETHALPQSSASQDGPQPIFVIGLPRSGTTVLERLLGNHAQVTAAGELFDFGQQLQWGGDHSPIQDDTFRQRIGALDMAEVGRRYLAQTQWRARDARRFVDKQTSNWMLAGLLHAALPRAPILHMVREPMATCFSIFRALFGDSYAIGHDLATLAAHYRQYRRLMARWHALAPGAILDVRYDDLVQAPEATMRKVLAFCGLPWEPACMDLAANRDPGSTLSAVQVRQPLHRHASDAWRHYAPQLRGLCEALAGIR